MKKYKNTFWVLILTLCCAVSCVDLEEQPMGLLAPESFYRSEADFEAAVIGLYRSVYGGYEGLDFNNLVVLGGGAEDINSILKPRYIVFDNFTADANVGSLSETWSMWYKAITNANSIIGNIGMAVDVPQDKLDAFEGQARFMRAMGYYYLTRYWGEVPIVNFDNQSKADVVGQSTVSDIYDEIIEDLKIAEVKLPVSFPERGKATRGAAKSLLASVYLSKAGWPLEDASAYALARDKAKEVIDAGWYKLEEDFQDLWLAENKLTNSEFIFTLYGISENGWIPGSHLHAASRPVAEGGWSDWHTEERFLDAFPEGYRKEVSFHTVLETGQHYSEVSPFQPYCAKYRDAGPNAAGLTGPVKSFDGDGFSVLFRYAEILLIYAEAANMAENGPSAAALEAVNKVRRRAMKLNSNNPDPSVDLPSGMSQIDFNEKVLAERAWELAFENKRWFDLVRKKLVVEVNNSLHPNVSAKNRWLPKPALQVALTEGLDQNDGY